MAGVPATITQGSERTQVVILGKPNQRGIIEGVDHQGNIRYRPVRVLNLTSKPSYGWRITGPGYNDVTNPTLNLQVGHSYLFRVDDVQRYPFFIYKPNPDPTKRFEKEPYTGFEILNNGSDINYVRFTLAPTPQMNLPTAIWSIIGCEVRSKSSRILLLTTKEKKSSSQ